MLYLAEVMTQVKSICCSCRTGVWFSVPMWHLTTICNYSSKKSDDFF